MLTKSYDNGFFYLSLPDIPQNLCSYYFELNMIANLLSKFPYFCVCLKLSDINAILPSFSTIDTHESLL